MFGLGRGALVLAIVVAAVAIPFFASSDSPVSGISDWLSGNTDPSAQTGETGGGTAASESPAGKDGEDRPVDLSKLPPEGMPVGHFSEVFRYDVTPDWILSRWPRVSTGLADVRFHGYRVPLVTGVAQDDLAGALTYYFDERHQMRRLTFKGTTGDFRRLVTVITAQFGLERQLPSEPGVLLFQQTWNGKVQGELRVQPAPVVKASAPHRRYFVSLDLTKPEPTWRQKVFVRKHS